MPSSSPIFISYAHEDADAARQIAEALRAFGLTVWFDQNELRGGDQWDAKIRGQIKACALFIPIISRTTQSRDEAYFRLEWKLAEDRSYLMAPGKAFVVPVVIDDTPEYDAIVPEAFTKAQWSRLPGGNPSTAFVEQVRSLAQPTAATAPVPASTVSTPSTPPPPASTTTPPIPAKSKLPLRAGLLIAIMVIAGGIALWKKSPPEPVQPVATQETPPAAPAADRRSIAVLPFANMSEDASTSSFVADGIHEDLLTNLSFIGDLRVVSRTSVMQYRNTEKPVRQIAQELRVGTLLEGSVRRAGDRLRVTAQLIDANTDEHIWAQTYDRELKDIFAIQGELAKAIAQALKVALTDQQAETIAHAPTENTAAYELFLRERELEEREGNNKDRVRESINLIQRAVALDPNFAQAWSLLAVLHAQTYFWQFDRDPHRIELATTAIEKALALAPNDLEVLINAGSYHYYGHRDYTQAATYYQRVLDVAPNNVDAIASMGFIRRREGRWAESAQLMEKALDIDPRNVSVLRGLTTSYELMRQFERAIELQKRLLDLFPDSLIQEYELVDLQCKLSESIQPALDILQRYEMLTTDVPLPLWNGRYGAALFKGDWATCHEMLEDPPPSAPEDNIRQTRIFLLASEGRIEEARELATAFKNDLLPRLAEDPSDDQVRGNLFAMACVLDTREEALEYLNYFEQDQRARNDAVDGQSWRLYRVYFLMFFGTPEETLDALRDALKYPGARLCRWDFMGEGQPGNFTKTPEFKAFLTDPAWDPLPID